MENYQRYAVYYAPRAGDFADRCSDWLAGTAEVSGPEGLGPHLNGDLTSEPRRYGFHATLRAPFRAANGVGGRAIAAHVAALAETLAPPHCEGLRLADLDGFVALVPQGDATALMDFAAGVVTATNALRAPLDAADIARRRPEGLTPRQKALLEIWGYPYVMEEFRFHLTLTNRLAEGRVIPVISALTAHFAPVLPRPFVIEDLSLFGEDASGRFHLLSRHALIG